MPKTIDSLAVNAAGQAMRSIGSVLETVARGSTNEVSANQALSHVIVLCMSQEMVEEDVLDTVENAIGYANRRIRGR